MAYARTTRPLVRPPELDSLDLERSAVIEASAGTGKTYLLEHLVLDLIISGRARLSEILVVTFTERATAELVSRIRLKIDQALAASDPSLVLGWTIDDLARARLTDARQSFDQASITTIHSFCQRLLTDEPFATRRLLGQSQVDGLQAFGEVFRDVLRRVLTTDESHRAYLSAYLASGRTIDQLEELLYRASTARGQWDKPYVESDLAGAVADLGDVKIDGLEYGKLLGKCLGGPGATALRKRLSSAIPEARACVASRSWGQFLAFLDDEARAHQGTDLFRYFEDLAARKDAPAALAPLRSIGERLLDQAPPLDEAVAQRFLPPIAAELARRKLTEGLYDYDDMIGAVDEALQGNLGPDLVASLRRRYRFALIDEAQDTEPAQWRIFERVFLDSDGPNPVVLIADPKQAIYGFRGADVHTYVAARQAVRARGGTILPLTRNYRSHPEVISAYNAIFEHTAAEPYFTDTSVTYDAPVTGVLDRLGPGPGVTLFRLEAPQGAPAVVAIGPVRQALRDAIATQIARLKATQPSLPLSEIFVLTRSNPEAREVAARLHEAGIPNSLFRPDYIFQSAEARHVRALLLAIADPTDRAARLSAWLTPFFDVSLDELAKDPDPAPDHPLMTRLSMWKALADARAYDQLWAHILDDSGVTRRLRLAPAGLRRLTNYRHLFDVLLREGTRPISVVDLAALLATLAAGHRRPAGDDDDNQRLETEADAVRISTVHAAKGLEADYVIMYGGLTARRIWRGEVHAFHRDTLRVMSAGRSRRGTVRDRIDANRHQEDQRLLYVALTRARKHLYLPFFPRVEAGESDDSGADFDLFKRISGPYRHVNQRLRALHGTGTGTGAATVDTFTAAFTRAAAPAVSQTGEASALFATQTVPIADRPPPDDEALRRALAAWTPVPELVPQETAPASGPDAATLLRVQRRGFVITSYSRIKEARGHIPSPTGADGADVADLDDAATRILDPIEIVDPVLAPEVARDRQDALPGGAASGLFLHAVLEKVALGEIAPLSTWQAQPEVRQLIETELRRWDRDPRHLESAARLVHAALTVPIDLPDAPSLPGISRAARARREVAFLFPLPDRLTPLAGSVLAGSLDDRLSHERGFVRGFMDVLFEHAGRVCFADWKSDVLPSFDRQALGVRVDAHYGLQIRLYTLALVRMLGVESQRDYDSRFGGFVYLFLRGLEGATRAPSDGIYVARPDYSDVVRWDRELAELPTSPGSSELAATR